MEQYSQTFLSVQSLSNWINASDWQQQSLIKQNQHLRFCSK